MSRRRFLRLLLTATAALLVVLYAWWWRSPARASVVTTRWPATSPVVQGQDIALESEDDTLDAAPPAMELAPGVRVRVGTAHDLAYFEVVLGDVDFDDELPLVVLLHGRGDRPRIPGGPFTSTPTPMRLIIPRGPLRVGAGFAWVRPSVTQGMPELLASALRTRTDHVAALIETLATTLPTLGRPMVTGFSQGALLSFSLALHRPDVVGHAFPLAGWVPPALMPEAPVAEDLRVPIRAVHGTEDAVIPIGPTREAVATLRALEWDTELVEFEGVGHVISPEMNATFELWLEAALYEEAPGLTGRGLGLPGPEDEPYEPSEPLEPETIEAIEQLEAEDAASVETTTDTPPEDPGGPAEDTDVPVAPADGDEGSDKPEQEGARTTPIPPALRGLAPLLLAAAFVTRRRRDPPGSSR